MLMRKRLRSGTFSSATAINGDWIDIIKGSAGRLVGFQYKLTYTSGTFSFLIQTSDNQTDTMSASVATASISSSAGNGFINLALASGVLDTLQYQRVVITPTVGTAAGTLELWACFAP